jgi:hypothetical protein
MKTVAVVALIAQEKADPPDKSDIFTFHPPSNARSESGSLVAAPGENAGK